MSEKESDRAGYERAREEFNRMNLEDQASFLLEAVGTTVLRGVGQASSSLADEFEEWMQRRRASSRTSQENEPGPAEPESSDSNPSAS